MVEEELKIKTKKSKGFWVKFISISIIIISWIIFISWSRGNPELSLRNPLIIVVVVSVLGVVAMIGYSKFEIKESKEEQVPSPIKSEEIEKRLKNYFEEKYWFHIKKAGGLQIIDDKSINKNRIYVYKINFSDGGTSKIGIINANYPDRPITEAKIDISSFNLKKLINSKSENPFDDPEIRESETRLDEFGRPIQKTKETKPSKKKKEKEDVI